jgi:cytochrome P450
MGVGRAPFFEPQLGAWVISSYHDVEDVLGDPDTFSSKWAVGPNREDMFAPLAAKASQDDRAATAMMYSRFRIGSSDGDVHRRQRSFVAKAFTPRRVRIYEPLIQQISDELTDAIVGRTAVPFVKEFSIPLPVKIIAVGLGLPPDDYLEFKRWSDAIKGLVGAPQPTAEAFEEFTTATVELTAYIEPIIGQRRHEPTEDIISALVTENEVGETLSSDEILSDCMELLLGGNETTTAALSGMMLYLVRAPEVQEQAREDPTLIPAVVEEAVRLTSPAQGLFRRATTDTAVGGVPIAGGDYLLLRFAAANRDSVQFDQPFVPRLDRPDKRHVGFGRGVHVCPGAQLARAEMRIALETLLERTSSITLSDREDAIVPEGNHMMATIGELYLDVNP